MATAAAYAVGVGPGDPELLTRKGERILRGADVILAPVARIGEPSVALDAVRELLDPERQEIITHLFPMTADPGRLAESWQGAADLIAQRVRAGKQVAFITIGDPLLYSTSIYLLRTLGEAHPDIPVEIVPGISSINTAAAAAAIPLAESEERVAIIPATAGMDKIMEALVRNETVVLLKVKPVYGELLDLLQQSGRLGNTVFVERAGSPRQKILRGAEQLAGHAPDYLSLMIVSSPHPA